MVPPLAVRILLVEDEPLVSMMTAELLADAGFVVEEVSTAAEAIAKLQAAAAGFAAAIIDLGLPDRPGDVLAEEVRRMRADMPIVIASGRNRHEVARLLDGDGKAGFVGKPYVIDALLEVLRTLGVSAAGE
jgi:DNA-binding response OmpR family regulator